MTGKFQNVMQHPLIHTLVPGLLRWGQRWLMVYFLLYLAAGFLLAAWVPWLGHLLLGPEAPLTYDFNGSGDTTYENVYVLACLALATVLSGLWSLGWGSRPVSEKLWRWFEVALRINLCWVVFSYGVIKLLKSQFPFPSLGKLAQPLGDFSPMGLAWAYMGYSTVYNLFTGGLEMLAALLMLFSPTLLLGALLNLGVMGHVLVMNLSFDIPVKLYSLHLVLMTLLLIAPHGQRLWRFFIRQQPVEPLHRPPLIQRLAWRRLLLASKLLVLGLFSLQVLPQLPHVFEEEREPRPPLYGIYEVQEFQWLEPPATGKSARGSTLSQAPAPWQRLIIEWEGYARVYTPQGELWRLQQHTDQPRREIRFVARSGSQPVDALPQANTGSPTPKAYYGRLTYHWRSPVLELQGTLAGHAVKMHLRQKDPQQFLLLQRGFHWINETPFNR